MRICLFGGTFDPIHNAHLRIALEAKKKLKLDRVLFVPAANPPHKDASGLASYDDRFEMVKRACGKYSGFVASTIEAGKERSYSIDTVEHLRATLGLQDELFFLIGSDAFDEIETWKRWKQLMRLVTFIVAARPGREYHVPDSAHVIRLDSLALPVSSSEIRSRLAAGEPTPELPRRVLRYIEARGLYGFGKRKTIASP